MFVTSPRQYSFFISGRSLFLAAVLVVMAVGPVSSGQWERAFAQSTPPPAVASSAPADEALGKAKQAVEGKDFISAVFWFRAAAEDGNIEAQNELGDMYRNGSLLAENIPEAKRWFLKTAQAGSLYGQFALGGIACDEHNSKEAILWMGKAAKQGFEHAEAFLGAAYAGLCGDIGPDVKRGISLLRKGAAAGNQSAQHLLGVAYYFGKGVPRNRALAREWSERAAAAGHTEAQRWLREEFKNR